MKITLEVEIPQKLIELDKILSKPPTQEEIAKIRLQHMNVAVEIGCTYNVLKMIKKWGSDLESNKDSSIETEYAKILKTSKRMAEVEEKHGAGCLLKLDHPIVISLLARTPPTFPESEVEAAKRYKILTLLDLDRSE